MAASLTDRSQIERALTYVSELLDAEGEAFAIVILGGAALNLLGVVARTTTDVDILAVGRPGDVSRPRRISEPPKIFFKLFAAADDIGTAGVHYQDLIALKPTSEELKTAATWVRGQDASPAFVEILEEVITHVRRHFGFSERPVGGTE